MKKVSIPENISVAVNAMLEPFGFSMENLKSHHSSEDSSKKYFSVVEAEEYTSVSRWTLSRAIKSGKLNAIKLSRAKSGKVLIERNDIDKWLSSYRIRNTKTGGK